MSPIRRRRDGDLLDLEDVERRLRPISRRYLGVRAIPIDRIVGTEGRASAFTREFTPRHSFSRDRLRSLASAFPDGGFPPIVAVKLGDTYFVIDGHHRVAFARRHRTESIDADVTEFVTRVPLPPGADMLQVVLRELERIFLEESGIADARPGVRIAASRPGLYLELLENLQVHGYHLMREQNQILDDATIAGDWYDRIYAPVIDGVDRGPLGGEYRNAADGDLFLLLHRRRRDAFPSCGCPPLKETADSVAADAAAAQRRRIRVFRRS